jgi:hypothetical protein
LPFFDEDKPGIGCPKNEFHEVLRRESISFEPIYYFYGLK